MLTTRKFGAAARFIAAGVAAVSIVLGALVAAPAAFAGTDDYPAKWKSIPRDTTFDTWGMYNRECTSWVAWRLHNTNHFEIPFHANADRWGPRAKDLGYTVDTKPAVGAVAWWSSMHVAWVEAVNPDGTITIEEYNIGGSGKYDRTTIAATRPTGYIHFQDLATSFADGSYIIHNSKVYRMAGGAPLFVSTWTDWGKKPAGLVSSKQWAALRKTPVDGTYLTTDLGKYVYRVVGGAPVYLGGWDAVGGKQNSVSVRPGVITNAGAPAGDPYLHLNYYPTDATYVVASPSNTIYQITKGAAEPVQSWDAVGGEQPYVTVSDDSIAEAGAEIGTPFSHLRGHLTSATPMIRGAQKIGRTLSALHKVWAPSDVTWTYQWMRNGVAIKGAHAKIYKLSSKDLGGVVSVSVTGSKSNYNSVTVVSAPGIKVHK